MNFRRKGILKAIHLIQFVQCQNYFLNKNGPSSYCTLESMHSYSHSHSSLISHPHGTSSNHYSQRGYALSQTAQYRAYLQSNPVK
jgi:hypothetical protein